MVLAKADGRIAAEYDRRLVPEPLQAVGTDLRARLARAIRGVLDISGHQELLGATPVIRRSIDVRNPYVDPPQPVAGRTAPAGPARTGPARPTRR
jgi:phosphoenolpyruvate carboxylase